MEHKSAPSNSAHDGTTRPTLLEDYEFDLRGFLVVRGALSPDEVAELNDAYDRFPELANGTVVRQRAAP